MRKVFLLIVFFSAFANALSLEQIRNNLIKNLISRDSVEMRIRSSVSSSMLSGKQNVYIYMVRKGFSKIYTELKLPFVNQRSIVNGSMSRVCSASSPNRGHCK